MPKQQLKFPIALKDKIKVAFTLQGVKVENSKTIGDQIFAFVTHNGQNLVDALTMLSNIKGDELDEPKEEKEKASKAK